MWPLLCKFSNKLLQEDAENIRVSIYLSEGDVYLSIVVYGHYKAYPWIYVLLRCRVVITSYPPLVVSEVTLVYPGLVSTYDTFLLA